jgi:hypothetical protein
MTPGFISASLRARLRTEAQDRCGYCQTQQALAYGPLEVDHIVPVVAGGSDNVENLSPHLALSLARLSPAPLLPCSPAPLPLCSSAPLPPKGA